MCEGVASRAFLNDILVFVVQKLAVSPRPSEVTGNLKTRRICNFFRSAFQVEVCLSRRKALRVPEYGYCVINVSTYPTYSESKS